MAIPALLCLLIASFSATGRRAYGRPHAMSSLRLPTLSAEYVRGEPGRQRLSAAGLAGDGADFSQAKTWRRLAAARSRSERFAQIGGSWRSRAVHGKTEIGRRVVSTETVVPTSPVGSTPRRVLRERNVRLYEDLKRQSLVDGGIVGVFGSILAMVNSGQVAAAGFALGAAAGMIYLLLLHFDVDSLEKQPDHDARTPFDVFNPVRFARILVPVVLVIVLALQGALADPEGLSAWLSRIRWDPLRNFVGVVNGPALYGGLIGYVSVVVSLQLRGLSQALPKARDLLQMMPGSFGVASKLVKEAEGSKLGRARQEKTVAARQLPLLLISGPRGVGKSTLAQRLLKSDTRFKEPQWVATAASNVGSGAPVTNLDTSDFEELLESGSLAVSYKIVNEADEEVAYGLPALSVIAAAKQGACLLDVDVPTARQLISYNWERAVAAASVGEAAAEINLVTVWVSLDSLDAIVERNREQREAEAPGIVRSSKWQDMLRRQASEDIEWAMMSGTFDFTLINKEEDEAAGELEKNSRYCFGDPF